MTSQSQALELAVRCEAATGPDRELDANIAIDVVDLILHGTRIRDLLANNSYADIGRFVDGVPAFTASLDAAMQLVPEGEPWTITLTYPDGVESAASALCGHQTRGKLAWGYACKAEAATPALALAAAALRALAGGGEG